LVQYWCSESKFPDYRASDLGASEIFAKQNAIVNLCSGIFAVLNLPVLPSVGLDDVTWTYKSRNIAGRGVTAALGFPWNAYVKIQCIFGVIKKIYHGICENSSLETEFPSLFRFGKLDPLSTDTPPDRAVIYLFKRQLS
jgi:hypothetical protein